MFKNPGIPHVGQHCIVHEGAQEKKGDDYFGLKIRECDLNYIANLPIKTYFMDDQRRSLNETVLLSTLNICFKFS